MLVILLLVVVAVLFVLYTATGSGFALRTALSIYDDMIPGHATVESIDGSLGDGVTLGGVVLSDRFDRPLVEANRLFVQVGWSGVARIELDAPRVYALSYAAGGFGDLAPEGPPSEEEAEEGPQPFGPDIPLALDATLRLRGGLVITGEPHAPSVVVAANDLTLVAQAEGLHAHATLQGWLSAPASELDVYWLALEVDWADPVAVVESLWVESNLGTVALECGDVDLRQESFAASGLRVVLDPDWFEIPAAAEIELAVAGKPGDFSGDVLAWLPGAGEVDAAVFGSFAPELDVALLLDAAVEEVAALGLPALSVEGTADALGQDGGTQATVDLACHGCLESLGPLTVRADAFADEAGTWGSGRVEVEAEAARAEVDAAMGPDGVAGLLARVDVPQLATFAPLVRRFAPELDLRGVAGLTVGCAAVVDPRAAACRAQVGVDKGRPLNRARLDVGAALIGEDGVTVNLRRLLLAAPAPRGAGEVVVEQRPAEATIRYTPEGVAVGDLALNVASRTGTGSVRIDGQLGLGDANAASVNARVKRLDLAALNAFVPSLAAAGTVDVSVDADGTLSAPRVSADVRGRGLAVQGLHAGDVTLHARYADDEVTANLHAESDHVGRVTVDAAAPLRLDLESGTAELVPDAGVHASVSLRGLPLATVARFAPAARPLSGSLDLDFRLDRSLRRPKLGLAASVRGGQWDGKALPDVDIDAGYTGGTATADLTATHRTAFDRLAVSATVPVRLDLSTGRARWLPGRPHRVDLDLEGAQLAEAKRWDTRADVAGRVDLHAKVSGSMQAPVLTATVAAEGLRYEEREVGETSLALSYAESKARLELFAAGPYIGGIGAEGEVPVTVVPASGRVTWHQEQPHRLRVSVNEVVLDRAIAWATQGLPPGDVPVVPVRGRLHAELAADGPATDPSISLHTTIEDGAYRGRAVGALGIEAEYRAKRARVELSWSANDRHTGRVTADVPVVLDLPAGAARWQRDGQHHVRVAFPRVDRELLEPFVDIGALDVASSLYVVADGNATKFKMDAAMRGTLRANKDVHRVRVDATITDAEQDVDFDIGWGSVVAHTKASIPALLEGSDWRGVPLQLRAEVDGAPLATLQGFVPPAVQGLGGRLTVNAAVDGTLGKPVLDGEVKVRKGAATIVPARARIEKLELAARLDNDHLAVERLTFGAGAGRVSGRGRIDVKEGEGLVGSVTLDIDDFPLRSPGLPRMTLTGDIETKLAVGLSSVDVGVGIAGARVDVQASGIVAGRPIAKNANIRYVDFGSPHPRAVEPAPGEEAGSSTPTNIAIRLADPLRIVGPAVDMAWGGAMKSKTGPSGTATSGDLRAQRGYFDLLGNKFDLERGTVTLPEEGGLPFVDVVANTEVDDARITATIRGQLPKPELVLSSSPAMTQSEIFTVLVTGSTDTSNADPDEVEAKAASVLAAVSNPALQRQLNQRLHVDRIGVGFGESTEQPILTVGKNVSKKVYAETQYHHNAPKNDNRAEVRVEYRFAPRWSLETFFGDAAEGGIDLFWGRAFNADRKTRGR